MNQKILFSPVGGTDPIALNNERDGSMLHICRWYKPDKVILYMSKEILDNEKNDHRYTYCLDKLADLQNRIMQYEFIEKSDLTEVQKFDYFYAEFRSILGRISRSMDDTDELLLNISSGTPAMKSVLVVLQTIEEYPRCRLIQVTTPIQGMNEHTHDGYDVEILWGLDGDNEDGSPNRCHEVTCPSLSVIQSEDIIKKNLLKYDYAAALDLAKFLPKEETSRYIDLLQMARARSLLDISEVDRIQKKNGLDIIPVKSGDIRFDFEYALDLQNKYRRKEYADFLRGISPLLLDLYEILLKTKYKVDIRNYSHRNSVGERRWDLSKLKGTDVYEILNTAYIGSFYGGTVGNANLRTLASEYSQRNNDGTLHNLIDQLTAVENTRNLAAHQVIGVTDDLIQKLTGFTSKEIMQMIRELFRYVGVNNNAANWKSYDTMNQLIIERIG